MSVGIFIGVIDGNHLSRHSFARFSLARLGKFRHVPKISRRLLTAPSRRPMPNHCRNIDQDHQLNQRCCLDQRVVEFEKRPERSVLVEPGLECRAWRGYDRCTRGMDGQRERDVATGYEHDRDEIRSLLEAINNSSARGANVRMGDRLELRGPSSPESMG